MREATVSVIMAAFDAEASIDRAIGSVVAQTFAGWELVVVDDGSRDGTAERVLAWSSTDPRIRLFRLRRHGGPSVARNRGIDHARGAWITILDTDDAFAPERLERMLAAAAWTGAGFIADNLLSYDVVADRITSTAYAVDHLRALSAADFFLSEMGRSLALGFLKPLIRLDALRQHGIRYREDLRYAEDFTLYTELMFAGVEARMMPEAFYLYTRQVGAASGQASPLSKTRYTPWTRLEIVRHLTGRYGARMTPAERAMMARYAAWATTYAQAHCMSEHKNARRYAAMGALMIRQPKAAARFLLAQRPLRTMFGTGF